MNRPPHHGPDGRFRAPWPEAAEDGSIRRRFGRVAKEWLFGSHPPDPEPGALPRAEPRLAWPGDGASYVRITWVGHATFLIQLPGLNLLTDPIWSDRPSPVPFGTRTRFVPAVPALEALPPIHGVLLSHDHYDHLDRSTVLALHRRFGPDLRWYAPLGFDRWLGGLGIVNAAALDWWEEAPAPGGRFTLTATPARHWCRRAPWDTNRRLWSGWAITPARPGAAGPRIYFTGDTAYVPIFEEIGRRLGPFDASMIPIGAYEPRWFMKASHVNPEEAVRIWRELGGSGAFVPMHWGTFRLTFEDPLEPPERLRAAWSEQGLPADALEVLRHGETLVLGG